MGQHHPFGVTGGAAGSHDESITGLARLTSRQPVEVPGGAQFSSGGKAFEQSAALGWRQPGVDRNDSCPLIPELLQLGDKTVASGGIDGDNVGHVLTLASRPPNSSPGPVACNASGVTDPHATTIRPAADWQSVGDYGDIRYEVAGGIAKITINRPEVRNAFRPQTLFELSDAFDRARDDDTVGVIIFTGAGDLAFCSGGDQRIRGDDGYIGDDEVARKGIGRLNVLDLQIQIRRTPKPVVAMVAGYAIGGGHVLHVVCDLTIAADNARFGQTGPKVGSFDGGYGSGLLAASVGQKKAREIWYLCRQYDAAAALDMGLVNTVVPLAELEEETVRWCNEMLQMSPLALRMLKASMNAADDGLAGIQQLAGDATLLFYMTEEAQEGRDAYTAKRAPDFSRFPRRP